MSQDQIDWNLVAEKFDLWLPHIQPVGEVLIDKLEAAPGHRILDVACGTGEPALTLARRLGKDARITAVDAAEGMVGAARRKAKREGLESIRFEAMAAESLTFEDDTFDRVICRFGVMLFKDPVAGLAEMWRVLRPGGRFSLAVWGDMDATTSFRIVTEILEPRLPKGSGSPFMQVTSLGQPGALEAALETAGFQGFEITRHQLDYTFADFATYWELVEQSGVLKKQFDALSEDDRRAVRDEVGTAVRAYHQDGRLVLPHAYLVASGSR